jgi:hypothetical protein
VRLTPAGRDRVDAALADLLDQEAVLLAPLKSAARQATGRALASLLEPLEGIRPS